MKSNRCPPDRKQHAGLGIERKSRLREFERDRPIRSEGSDIAADPILLRRPFLRSIVNRKEHGRGANSPLEFSISAALQFSWRIFKWLVGDPESVLVFPNEPEGGYQFFMRKKGADENNYCVEALLTFCGK